MMGSMFQNGGANRIFGQGVPQQTGNFNVSLVVLSAAVMKADGTVKKSELDYVKKFFVHNFGTAAAQQYVKMLGEILKQDFNVNEVAQQVGHYMDYASKLQLLHYLFGIAQADGSVSKSETDLLSMISASMSIPSADFESLKAMFVKNTDSAYTILGIKHDATEEEIKAAYREMAKKYHPDKVAHLGDDVKKAAEEKFQSVNEAYEAIKRERGIK
ncbi:MAG: TerB family tellurite resistance protein [Bacteroidales bacterium]|nr:TerB family tellurite resistance protein [Bacteroidales bacterium]